MGLSSWARSTTPAFGLRDTSCAPPFPAASFFHSCEILPLFCACYVLHSCHLLEIQCSTIWFRSFCFAFPFYFFIVTAASFGSQSMRPCVRSGFLGLLQFQATVGLEWLMEFTLSTSNCRFLRTMARDCCQSHSCEASTGDIGRFSLEPKLMVSGL